MLNAYFDEAGLPFYGIRLSLCEPLNENGQNAGEAQINLFDLLCADITGTA